MSVHDDEEDFELPEEDDEDGIVYDEEEEEDVLDMEEEEDESLIQYSDDSDSPTIKSKSKSKSKSELVEDDEQPLVDIRRIQRRKRILTREQFDITCHATSTSLCSICNKQEDALEGGFISQYPIIYKDERYFVHKACVLCCPDTARSSSSYYNLNKAIHAGRKIHCHACGQNGATFWCQVSGCSKYVHLSSILSLVVIIIIVLFKRILLHLLYNMNLIFLQMNYSYVKNINNLRMIFT